MPNDQLDANADAESASEVHGHPEASCLEAQARELAGLHTIARRPRPTPFLIDRLDEREALLRRADARLREASKTDPGLAQATEWLFDNDHVVQQALRQIRQDMPKGYYRRLPRLGASSLEGYPRVYALALAIVTQARGRLSLEQVTRFVQAYQAAAPLTIGELWALPTLLRLVTLDNLVTAAARLAGLREEGERPALPGGREPGGLAGEAIIAESILSLRLLATHDWKAFFESVSQVERVLRTDPAAVYARMDFETRNRYRQVIEELARATGHDEERVAEETIGLAGQAAASPGRRAHVGFYLVGAGRPQLEVCLHYRPPWAERLRRRLAGHRTSVYLGSIAAVTLAALLGPAAYARSAGAARTQLIATGLLCLLPALAAAVALVHWLIIRTVHPRVLPRLDFRQGLPGDCRAIVVVPALVTSSREANSLLRQLELGFLGNQDPNLWFALLTDYADAPQQHMPGDEALLAKARAGVRALNEKYGSRGRHPFYFFHRERRWNPAEECWMGWERKRGKLAEFSDLLTGRDGTSFAAHEGNPDLLAGTRYVITLDADSILPRDTAQRLVATLAHPLNRPEFDPVTGRVVAGYGVLQPRVEILPTSANRSPFTQVFAGDTHVDLYTRATSDVYQDLFGEGMYVGKGIYDVAALQRSLGGRMPENALLSHDLLEGVHARAGLATDIILYEDFPPHYLAWARRLHRWIRGDWQLLPWLLPRAPHASRGTIPNDLSLLDRWKILDNLRRSLLAPALLVLLAAGWLWLPGSPSVWTLAALLAAAFPVIADAMTALSEGLRGAPWRGAVQTVRNAGLRCLFRMILLPYEALLSLDAIGATLIRLTITRKHLLQWTTAAHTVRLVGRRMRLGLAWARMGSAALLALGLSVLLALFRPTSLPVAGAFLYAWLASPLIAQWISRPRRHRPASLAPAGRQRLRRLARHTWLYFERFVGPDDHWLPPDHFQEAPLGLVAHRTSPTNLGLALLSTLAAYDLGYIGAVDLSLRLGYTFQSMERMDRYRGHFLNWYDTRNLAPLPPRYVSTVDSGNLAGCLLALRQGCLAVPRATLLRWRMWQGLLDTLGVLEEVVAGVDRAHLRGEAAALRAHLAHIRQQVLAARHHPDDWPALLARLDAAERPALDRLATSLAETGTQGLDYRLLGDLAIWAERTRHHLAHLRQEIDLLVPWLSLRGQPPPFVASTGAAPALRQAWQALVESLPPNPRLDEIAGVCGEGLARLARLRGELAGGAGDLAGAEEARDWCEHLAARLDSARSQAQSLLTAFDDLCQQAEACFQEMDFRFLFDPQRQLFHIGYNVESEEPDRNFYDLLASEARLASLLAVARGDVPQSHWLHLARPLTRSDGARILLSWSGTMFEYLMPSLLLPCYEGTLLAQSCQEAVRRQIAYARQKGVPWGISESGYHRFDANRYYQYQAFGVPGLGIRQGLDNDLVISPYASLLALPFAPQAVLANAARLQEQGLLGRYGFYEAVDYTSRRLPPGEQRAIVYSYMVHHQAMIFLALAGHLDGVEMVRRLHADARVQSVDLLLREQVSLRAPLERPHFAEVRAVERRPRSAVKPWRAAPDAPFPQVHLLANGRYSLLITEAGAGYSRWQEVDLTRWRADTTLDDWGTWIYVQDLEGGALWSAGRQPAGIRPEGCEVLFHAHMAEFRRRDHDISLHMEVTVAAGDDIEIRRIGLTNLGDRPRRLALTSYGEVTLAPHAGDRRHPAFTRLFVEGEYLPDLNALLFRRRPRDAGEAPVYLVHLLVNGQGHEATGAHETDRTRFLGRGDTARSPSALGREGSGLSGTTGATLDPIMALGQEIELEPHATATVAYLTLAAESREEALALAGRYRTLPAVDSAFRGARSAGQLELRRLGVTTAELEQAEQLLSALLYPSAALRGDAATLASNRQGQPGLWPYAVSGDDPILLLRVGDEGQLPLAREVLRAHACWRSRQVRVDLVILNERDTGYAQDVHGRLQRLLAETGADAWLNRRGGVFILRADQMPEASRVLFAAEARVVLDGARGSLAEQLGRLHRQPARLPALVPTQLRADEVEPTPPVPRPAGLLFDNGLGGFAAGGREYVIYLEPGQTTPAPWINVVANPDFGFLVSELGGGYTWAINSGENRLTPWRNDPVTDAPGEALYLRDEETAEVWTPTPLPARAPAPYLVRHGAGYSIFEHHSHGLEQRLRLFAPLDAPVKVVQLRLHNTWKRSRRLTATFYAEWVLGTDGEASRHHIVPELDTSTQALLARNAYNVDFGQRVAFAAAGQELHGLTGDRGEFLGRWGSYAGPAALERVGLEGAVAPGLDPCAALQVHVELAPGETKELLFLLGQGANREEALRLLAEYRHPVRVQAAFQAAIAFWDGLLGAVQVETPEPAMDLLLNRWLLYQTLSCRMWGRSALYQSSGAFGYRDQLQDAMALVHSAPHLTRDGILRAARHQFAEGDVLHWWHPPSGHGVRTRCSDDLVWLPFVTAHYVETTGDESVLSEREPFLAGEQLEPGHVERYGQYGAGADAYTVYEHCLRALHKGSTAGPHGLPLIGSCDWNDGFSRVGVAGRGESVWLGWFRYAALIRFAHLCDLFGEGEDAAACRQHAHELRQALAAEAWDGNWYLRAYYDDGTPLGSAQSDECQIDSLAQSWAVLSGAADPDRARKAMEAVIERLVRWDDRLLLLFAPPFDKTAHDPGYVKGYPPGIRENGGQYTHAALWVVWAFAGLGEGDLAEALFRLLSPIYHADTPEKAALYRVEPYVVAADVYGMPPHTGRGGWTWYTGSAGWMYRLGLEGILGLRRLGRVLRVDPCIPRSWPGYELTYREGDTRCRICVENPRGVNHGVQQVTLDGETVPGGDIPLLGDGVEHTVRVLMG